jgi:hypothetical protein
MPETSQLPKSGHVEFLVDELTVGEISEKEGPPEVRGMHGNKKETAILLNMKI